MPSCACYLMLQTRQEAQRHAVLGCCVRMAAEWRPVLSGRLRMDFISHVCAGTPDRLPQSASRDKQATTAACCLTARRVHGDSLHIGLQTEAGSQASAWHASCLSMPDGSGQSQAYPEEGKARGPVAGIACNAGDWAGEAAATAPLCPVLSISIRSWGYTDSNRRHSRCKRDALTAEL